MVLATDESEVRARASLQDFKRDDGYVNYRTDNDT
jgi:hypothetical protein